MEIGAPIRVLLSDMPPILHDIISSAVMSRPELRCVGNVEKRGELPEVIERTGANIVISGGNISSEEYHALLYNRPRLKVLEINSNDGSGQLYELRLQRIPLGELSLLQLLDILEGAARGT
jgi:hypothetical protein